MAILVKKIIQNEVFSDIYAKGFRIGKYCGEKIDGNIVAVAVGFLDALILAQGTQYSNSIFWINFFSKITQLGETLGEFIEKIKSGQADLNEFTVYCKTKESKQPLLDLGKTMLKIEENTQSSEISFKIGQFCDALNFQVHIYEEGKSEVEKIVRNRFTDALVINLFKQVEGGEMFYSIYKENYKILSIENLNVSQEFMPGQQYVSGEFFTLLVIKKLINDLGEYVIETGGLKKAKEAYDELKNESGVEWNFERDFQELLENQSACVKCNKMRGKTKLSCGCLVCADCENLSGRNKKCVNCSKVINTSGLNYS